MATDTTIVCEGSTYNAFKAAAIVFAIIYVAGLPAVLAVLLVHANKRGLVRIKKCPTREKEKKKDKFDFVSGCFFCYFFCSGLQIPAIKERSPFYQVLPWSPRCYLFYFIFPHVFRFFFFPFISGAVVLS